MQQFEEAVARWRKATALRPDSEFAFAHLGSALVRLQRPEEARQACLRALEIDPQNALARDVLERLGKR
jgi:Flp pilus assembly protein TadD